VRPSFTFATHASLYPILGLLGLLLATTLIYIPGLSGDLLLDDYENLRPFSDMLKGEMGWKEVVFTSESGPLGRSISLLTFVANTLSTGTDIRALKITNLAIHLLCGVLVYFLFRNIFRHLFPRHTNSYHATLALSISAMWLLAPLLVSTTLYIIQRMTQLSALFSLLGLLSYVKGRLQLISEEQRGWILILVSFVVWLPLAAFSKENGLLLPLLIFILELFIFNFRASTKNKKRLYALFLVTVFLPAILGVTLLLTTHSHHLTYGHRPFSSYERLLTESRVLFFYVSNLIIPHGPSMGLYHDDFTISRNLLSPITTLISIAGILLLPIIAYLYRKKEWWPIFFGPFFFLGGHVMESSFFGLELIFEHRNYLPSLGIFFSLVYGIILLANLSPRMRSAYYLLAILPILYGVGTLQRTIVWSSWATSLLVSGKYHPRSPRVHIETANLYTVKGEYDAALAELNIVAKLGDRASTGVAIHKGILYCDSKKRVPDTFYSDIASSNSKGDAMIYANSSLKELAKRIMNNKCGNINTEKLSNSVDSLINKSKQHYRMIDLWNLYYYNAILYRYAGNINRAITYLGLAENTDPSRPEASLTKLQYQFIAQDKEGIIETNKRIRHKFQDTSEKNRRLVSHFSNLLESANKITEKDDGGLH